MKHLKTVLAVTFLAISSGLYAQNIPAKEDFNISKKWSVLSGLIQPVGMGGVNIAVTYFGPKWTFEYSHGMFLHYPRIIRRDKNLVSLYSLYSTGPGIGYRIKKTLDIRFEVKVHQYEAGLNNNEKIKYTNADAGIGLYSRKYLFKKKESCLKAFFIDHSFRYWQNFYSTLDGRKLSYKDKNGVNQTHKPHNIGFFYNLSIGYTFGMHNKKNNNNDKQN